MIFERIMLYSLYTFYLFQDGCSPELLYDLILPFQESELRTFSAARSGGRVVVVTGGAKVSQNIRILSV